MVHIISILTYKPSSSCRRHQSWDDGGRQRQQIVCIRRSWSFAASETRTVNAYRFFFIHRLAVVFNVLNGRVDFVIRYTCMLQDGTTMDGTQEQIVDLGGTSVSSECFETMNVDRWDLNVVPVQRDGRAVRYAWMISQRLLVQSDVHG